MTTQVKPRLLLDAFDGGEWAYYLAGHDESGLVGIDELEFLEWEPLWMRSVSASSFTAPFWIECHRNHPDARPFLGVKYRDDT